MGVFWNPDYHWLDSLKVGEKYIGTIKTLSVEVNGHAVIESITAERGVKVFNWLLTVNDRTYMYTSALPDEYTFPKTAIIFHPIKVGE